MLEAGEDPRFIARRLVILAVRGRRPRRPHAILVAEAAAHAVEYVGLPEAALNLAHAVIHLALAPKSNSVTAALGRGHGGGAQPPDRPGADASAGRALPRRASAGPRQGLRLSSRRAAGLGSAGAPPGRSGRRAVLPAERARRRARRYAALKRDAGSRANRQDATTMRDG